jgi:hypothetical protein
MGKPESGPPSGQSVEQLLTTIRQAIEADGSAVPAASPQPAVTGAAAAAPLRVSVKPAAGQARRRHRRHRGRLHRDDEKPPAEPRDARRGPGYLSANPYRFRYSLEGSPTYMNLRNRLTSLGQRARADSQRSMASLLGGDARREEARAHAAVQPEPPQPQASSFRRPTSPARCTWATRSTTRCRISCAASSACGAMTCCGSPAPTMPASPRRWWSSARWPSATSRAPRHRPRSLHREGLELEGESGGTIIGQLKRLGASCDWSRERFTMDEGLSAAVLKVFVQFYREGLIYKDKRLVNWDPKFETAISDLEVENTKSTATCGTSSTRWPAARPMSMSRRMKTATSPARDARLHLHRHHPARNHAGRRRGGRAPVR